MDSIITPECRKIIEDIIMIPYNIEDIIIIPYNIEIKEKNIIIIYEDDYEDYTYINHNIYYEIYKEIIKQYEDYDKSLKVIPSYLFKPQNNIIKNGFNWLT